MFLAERGQAELHEVDVRESLFALREKLTVRRSLTKSLLRLRSRLRGLWAGGERAGWHEMRHIADVTPGSPRFQIVDQLLASFRRKTI